MLSKSRSKNFQKQPKLEVIDTHKEEKPYTSFVTVARNDNHGGDFLPRMIVFITALIEQVKKHNLKAELIIVDWNPPPDKLKLSEALTSSSAKFAETIKNSSCKIRIIEVPPKIHQKFQHSDKIPLFQMIGKNVGIKRAYGQFVIATNVDVLFSDELMKSLSSKSLKPSFFYRVDRYDVMDLPYGALVSQQFDHCKHNIIRVNRKDGTFTTTSNTRIWMNKNKILFQYFGKYLRSNFHELDLEGRQLVREGRQLVREGRQLVREGRQLVREGRQLVREGINLIRFRQKNKKRGLKELKIITKLATKALLLLVKGLASLTVRAVVYLVKRLALAVRAVAYLVKRLASLAIRAIKSPISKGIQLITRNTSPGYPLLHTNACGDFTMMTREKWYALRGYPELEIFSWHIDSLMLQMAYEYGLKEKIFKNPSRMYHMEHSSGWTPEQQDNLFKRLNDKNIPYLSFDEFRLLSKKMHQEKHPILFNKEDWGIGSETLPEVCIN